MKITDKKFEDLKRNYINYLPKLHTVHEDFGGPSIYFHQQALVECRTNFLSHRHIEMIYATLASWGMHRMGKTNTKMVSFVDFKLSIESIKEELVKLKSLRLEDIKADRSIFFELVQDLCFSLKVSKSNSKVVGNSKALAHILPDLVPPVDRQYSIRFFAERLTDFKDDFEEKEFYRHILNKCFELVQILKDDSMIIINETFNTSLPKIFDNLLMIALKETENKE